METGIQTARLEQESEERFVALRRALGVTTFGINQMFLRPGQRGRIHRHTTQEEVYLVLEGELTLELGEDESLVLGRGELVRVAPDVRRRLTNRGDDVLVLLALGGAKEHVGRDGEGFADWQDADPVPPAELPLPSDIER